MKRQLLNTLFLITILSLSLLNESCKNVDEQKKSEKSTKQAVASKEHACISAKEAQLPPPDENTILSSEKLKVNEEKTSYFVSLNLIVDQLTDYQGEPQQVYRVERASNEKHNKMNGVFYFALPSKYNKQWNDLIIFSEIDKNQLWIGFKKKDKSIKLYKIYSYEYVDEKFGGGEIIIEAISNKKYKVI